MNAQHTTKKEHTNLSRKLTCRVEYHYYPVYGRRRNHPQESSASTKSDLMSNVYGNEQVQEVQ